MTKQTHIIRTASDRGRVAGLIAALDTTKETEVTVGPHVRKRSLSQNAVLWMWHEILANETGHSNDEIHEIIKGMFLRPRAIDFKGEKFFVCSTKFLSTIEFKEFLLKYHVFAATDLAINLPHPDDQGREAA